MSLYDDVLQIAKEYTGIAAEEYISRRCKSLGLLDARQLRQEHIDRIVAGIDVTAGAYMDEKRVEAFKEEILKLSNKLFGPKL